MNSGRHLYFLMGLFVVVIVLVAYILPDTVQYSVLHFLSKRVNASRIGGS